MRLELLAENSIASTVMRWVDMIKDDPNIDDIITAFEVARKGCHPDELYNQLSGSLPDIYNMFLSLPKEDQNRFRYYIAKIAPNEWFRFRAANWGWLPGMSDKWTWTDPRALEDAIININDDTWPINGAVASIAKCNSSLLSAIDPNIVKEFVAKSRAYADQLQAQPSMASAILKSIKSSDDKWNADYIKNVIMDIIEEYKRGVFNGDLVKHVYAAIKDDYHSEAQNGLPGIIQNIIMILIKNGKLIKSPDGSIHLATG